jgi:hypothetical protein
VQLLALCISGKLRQRMLQQHGCCLMAPVVHLQLGDAEEQDAAIGTTKDVFDELFSHQLLLQLYGSISEVSLLIGGRAPVCWWPPSSLDALPSTSSITTSNGSGLGGAAGSAMAKQPAGLLAADEAPSEGPSRDPSRPASSLGDAQQQQRAAASAAAAALQTVSSVAEGLGAGSSKPAMLVALEQEVDLVAIKFQGAQVGVNLGGEGFVTEVAMAALTMDDLLVGARCPGKAHMAESSVNWEQQQQEKQQQQAEQQHQAVQQAAAATVAGDAQAPRGEEAAASAAGEA